MSERGIRRECRNHARSAQLRQVDVFLIHSAMRCVISALVQWVTYIQRKRSVQRFHWYIPTKFQNLSNCDVAHYQNIFNSWTLIVVFCRSASNPQFVRSFNKLRSISMPSKLQPSKLSASEGKFCKKLSQSVLFSVDLHIKPILP